MSHASSEAVGAVERHRATLYNAAVDGLQWLHDELIIFRIKPDLPPSNLQPGQYTTLGLGNWEPRVAGCQAEDPPHETRAKLIKRAYSLSCPMLDAAGDLLGIQASNGVLEFYIALVRQADHAPALTPRLFALKAGDRLFCGDHPHGHYSVQGVPADANIVFASTGTGEAPHNAMVVELLQQSHQGQIVAINCVRNRQDLGYLATHRRLEQRAPNYRYIALTTREPENLDDSHPDFVGKRYIQQYFESGDFTVETGLDLDPAKTHVFLCGNPDMIGSPLRDQPAAGTTAVLLQKGFAVDQPHHSGNVHFEKYW